MASGAPQYSDRVRVEYVDSPKSRLQFGGADLPYLPRIRVGVEANANGGGVARLLPMPLIDTGCTYSLIRAEDWDQVFDSHIDFVDPGQTSDGRQTRVLSIGGGRVAIRWGYATFRLWDAEGRITQPVRVLARFVTPSQRDRLRESLIGLGGGFFEFFRLEMDIVGQNWLVQRNTAPISSDA